MSRSAAFLVVLLWSSSVTAQGLVLFGDAISSIGGTSSSPGGMELGFTVGQPASGISSDSRSNLQESAGFWRWMLWRNATDTNDAGSEVVPKVYRLEQGHPNPFNPLTTIQFGIPSSAGTGVRTSLRVYSASGRLLRVLVDEPTKPGVHKVVWDGRDDRGGLVGSGIYFYRMDAGTFHATRKLVMIK